MLRLAALLVSAALAAAAAAGPNPGHAAAAPPPPDGPARRILVEPTRTSIYVGSVAMTLSPFLPRAEGGYGADYSARVLPYLFLNEKGRLAVDVSEEMLRQLAAGEPVEFRGRAERTDGELRRIEGRAVPADPASGKLKVRVFVSKRVELIFNTTYRIEPPPSAW